MTSLSNFTEALENSTNLVDVNNKTANLTLECNAELTEGALFEFITNGVLLNVVGLFGLFGNIISMIILSRPQMKSSINYLLIGLARCDTILIITAVSFDSNTRGLCLLRTKWFGGFFLKTAWWIQFLQDTMTTILRSSVPLFFFQIC